MSLGRTDASQQAGTTAAAAPKRAFRADIQGLRAFAVVVVIVNHMVGWPVGGFVGVDIFFVISGYLITGHLMKEWEKSGRISFIQFYQRRIKRILPASTLALVATVIVAFIVFPGARAWSTFWDGVWAMLFVGNWRFAASGTDYFAAEDGVSPLQHYWSLGVEEQFYFVWPWIMLLALVVVARRRPRINARVVASVVIGVLSLASFAWALYETVHSPTVAYFSTLSRAWELGVGALLALAAPLVSRVPESARPALAWVGIAGMVLSLFVITEGSAFPAPGALLPVLACALVIAAGEGGGQRHIGLLTNKVSGYIGDISFSLYLWHMPVIVLTASILQVDSWVDRLMQVLLIAAFSMAAYHAWEDPVRRSAWLTSPEQRAKLHRPSRPERLRATVSVGFLIVAVVMSSLLVFGERQQAQAHQQQQAEQLQRELKQAGQGTGDGGEEDLAAQMPAVAAIQEEIIAGVQMTEWGDVQEKLEASIGDHTRMDAQIRACSDDNADYSQCWVGPEDAETTVLLTGDSVGRAFAPAILANAEQLGWRIEMRLRPGCSFSPVTRTYENTADRTGCVEHKESVMEYIASSEPDLVLISNSVVPTVDENGVETTQKSWQAALEEYLGPIEEVSDAIVITGPPADKDMAQCYVRGGVPADCLGGITPLRELTTAAETGAAEATGAALVDTADLFCAVGRCPAVIGDIPVRIDRTHITVEYAEHLAPAMGELLARGEEETLAQ